MMNFIDVLKGMINPDIRQNPLVRGNAVTGPVVTEHKGPEAAAAPPGTDGTSNPYLKPGYGAIGKGLSKLDPTNIGKNGFHVDPIANTFNASAPTIPQADFLSALTGMLQRGPTDIGGAGATNGALQGGLANQLIGQGTTAYGQEQGLIGQLQNEAAGQGPGATLAQQLMRQATDENIKRSTGMIASQKGINPGLAAKLAADSAAGLNQNAAAQGAQLGLQQQLAARSQLGGLLGGDLTRTTNGASGLIDTGRGQDITQAVGQGQLDNSRLGILSSGINGQNGILTQGQLGADQLNAGVAHQNALSPEAAAGDNAKVAAANAVAKGGILGGLLNGGGGVLGKIGLEKLLGGGGGAAGSDVGADMGVDGAVTGGADAGEIAGDVGSMALYAGGGRVPGHARVAGNSYANDTVDAKLSPGEIVVPRESAHDPVKAMRFIDHVMGKGKSKATGYAAVLDARRELLAMKKQMHALEQKIGGAA
jgi:hypothetical protein